jgi:Spx/MgsR family transcriptional regulator
MSIIFNRRPLVYGISNCDTVKKSRNWLASVGVSHEFYDFKKQGLPLKAIDQWLAEVGYEKLLNRRGTSWRMLGEAAQASVVDSLSAREIMLTNSSVIKRPVVVWPGGQMTIGFDEAAWRELVGLV